MLLLKLYLGKMWVFLRPVLMIFLSEAGRALSVAASQAVLALAERQLTGDKERRDAAFDLIKEDLRRQGVVATASAINLAIESAVQGLKQ